MPAASQVISTTMRFDPPLKVPALTLSIDEYAERYIKPAMKALALALEDDVSGR